MIVIRGDQIKEDDFSEARGTVGGEGSFGWKIWRTETISKKQGQMKESHWMGLKERNGMEGCGVNWCCSVSIATAAIFKHVI
jgi:hypothetical protein